MCHMCHGQSLLDWIHLVPPLGWIHQFILMGILISWNWIPHGNGMDDHKSYDFFLDLYDGTDGFIMVYPRTDPRFSTFSTFSTCILGSQAFSITEMSRFLRGNAMPILLNAIPQWHALFCALVAPTKTHSSWGFPLCLFCLDQQVLRVSIPSFAHDLHGKHG